MRRKPSPGHAVEAPGQAPSNWPPAAPHPASRKFYKKCSAVAKKKGRSRRWRSRSVRIGIKAADESRFEIVSAEERARTKSRRSRTAGTGQSRLDQGSAAATDAR